MNMDLNKVRTQLDRMREQSASYKGRVKAHLQSHLEAADKKLNEIESLLDNGTLSGSSAAEDSLFIGADSHLKIVRDSVNRFGYDTETPG